ncbi:flagellar hook-associated protein FlgK [Pontibaca salina]|uniref:Flagellar hook-associated protein 1 n=1 Tax=Pontibaca salina TaxID=2795731 RepID=A0A934HQ11_9RHOB|nr:flagellar hook-associated protein FlgK [Pontibaca salina]MBI6628475.1 flagellar hook-associated protein FlgK [Pontibaca salina]
MSISAAFNSAISGLTVAKRVSQMVSENIANAMTPGYTRRSAELGSNLQSSRGVQMVGVQRHSDPAITANRRNADAEQGNAKVIADFHSRFQDLLGDPTDAASITQKLAQFESSLIAAASRPDSAQRLDAVAGSASDLAKSFIHASDGLRELRHQADREIGVQVDQLNAALKQIHTLNKTITAATVSGQSTDAFLDQRQKVVDQINNNIPINVVSRDNGQIALYTDGGAIILDGPAGTFGFESVRDAHAHITLGNGQLSGLTLNSLSLRTAAAGPIGGGTLSALFEVRDILAPQAQSELDVVAGDLIERFENADPTLATGEAGLFTDAGDRFDEGNIIGLAGRLHLNARADPKASGKTWRLRAGIGAQSAGATGDARQLQRFIASLSQQRPTIASGFGTGQFNASDLSSSMLSFAAHRSTRADHTLGFAAAAQVELNRIEQQLGVDTDAELQTLMAIEHLYGANARMIQALDDMMKTILRL